MTETATPRVWFITGASRGFGRQWALAALDAGDIVCATARNIADLDDLVQQYADRVYPIRLDITDREGDLAAIRDVEERFGRIDVLVNNAGYGHFGMFEEISENELREQMEANFFGAFWLSQAVLPGMRARRAGHIIQVSSIGGVTAWPDSSAYHASKWALEGATQALAQEVAGFGIRVTMIEPGAEPVRRDPRLRRDPRGRRSAVDRGTHRSPGGDAGRDPGHRGFAHAAAAGVLRAGPAADDRSRLRRSPRDVARLERREHGGTGSLRGGPLRAAPHPEMDAALPSGGLRSVRG
jgi:NAD(P)-dependent dehydrogenase (short-subunit alcohol dehydrogenase family)